MLPFYKLHSGPLKEKKELDIISTHFLFKKIKIKKYIYYQVIC